MSRSPPSLIITYGILRVFWKPGEIRNFARGIGGRRCSKFGFPSIMAFPKVVGFMSLFLATLITGLALIAWGLPFFRGGPALRERAFSLLRSQKAAYALFGLASLWFLYHVSQLGQADFGDYKLLLIAVFGVTAIAAFHYTPDFLAVRGLGGLLLLAASPLLSAAFGHYELPQRLLMVGLVFVLIIVGMFLGTMPYLLRDFFEWLWAQPKRLKIFGGAFIAYGAVLVVTSFTY